MEPLHFGPADRRLFGWLHVPADRPQRRTAVVLCHPFGQEYVLSHRAFHGFAHQLAEAGFATLRFDYFGTGDSAGELAQANLATMQDDVMEALRTVRARVRCDDVALAGMRLGGSLAALAAGASGLAALVLWDPVVDGSAFLRELQVAHWRETHRSVPVPERLAERLTEPLTEASGFPVSDRLRDELRAIDLRAAEPDAGLPVLLVATDRGDVDGGASRAEVPGPELASVWKGRGHAVETLRFPGPAVWEEDEQRVLVPRHAIQGAVRWMAAAC